MAKFRDMLAFWLLGLCNNMPYVIMIAGADEISSGGVGLVYFSQIFPSLMVKITGPYWFQLVTYRVRIIICAFLMALSFVVVAFGKGYLWLQLTGVFFSGLQSGMGEASILALTSFYDSRTCLTCWSSGTGFAGVAGYAWVSLFTLAIKTSLKVTLLIALIVPVAFTYCYFYVLETPSCERQTLDIQERKTFDGEKALIEPETVSAMKTLTFCERLKATGSLYPYMVPLLLVYFAEYCMQTGTWAAIGFPLTDKDARKRFYTYSGFCYQGGVFVSRSSGSLLQANRIALLGMALAQCGLLVFFWFVARDMFWYDNSLLILCFVVGLFGGGVYVNGFTLIAKETPPHLTEFALSAASVADTFGVMLADICGILMQGCLYSYHHLPGAKVHVSC